MATATTFDDEFEGHQEVQIITRVKYGKNMVKYSCNFLLTSIPFANALASMKLRWRQAAAYSAALDQLPVTSTSNSRLSRLQSWRCHIIPTSPTPNSAEWTKNILRTPHLGAIRANVSPEGRDGGRPGFTRPNPFEQFLHLPSEVGRDVPGTGVPPIGQVTAEAMIQFSQLTRCPRQSSCGQPGLLGHTHGIYQGFAPMK